MESAILLDLVVDLRLFSRCTLAMSLLGSVDDIKILVISYQPKKKKKLTDSQHTLDTAQCLQYTPSM